MDGHYLIKIEDQIPLHTAIEYATYPLNCANNLITSKQVASLLLDIFLHIFFP